MSTEQFFLHIRSALQAQTCCREEARPRTLPRIIYKRKTVALPRCDTASSFDLITRHLRLAEMRDNEALDIFPHAN